MKIYVHVTVDNGTILRTEIDTRDPESINELLADIKESIMEKLNDDDSQEVR